MKQRIIAYVYVSVVLLLGGCAITQPVKSKNNSSDKNHTKPDQAQECPMLTLKPSELLSYRIYELPTPKKESIFKKSMMQIALETRKDPKYKRLALDTSEEKRWFKELLYRLWDRQITRNEFIKMGLERYPDKEYEFRFIAEGLQKGCES